MAKIIMTCGMICSGKTTYAEKLRKELKAVILSVDEITLAMFDQDIGDKHDIYIERLENYFFRKSEEIIDTGINVIFDWGLWTKNERRYARDYYSSRGIECEIHYLDINPEEWKKRIEKRNKLISSGESSAYYVDEGLAEKVLGLFEVPDKDETDVWIKV